MSESGRADGGAAQRPRPPSVDIVLRSETGRLAVARFGQQATTAAVRAELEVARAAFASGAQAAGPDAAVFGPAEVARAVLRRLEAAEVPSVRTVMNLTGTVLHTNLGRAVLPEAAIAAAVAAMRAPVALEYDLASGKRGERDDHVRALVAEITGAEDVCLVNNNAAAVLLVLNALGAGREAIVSRGELIEIGGAFRLPDIMARAGVRLVEVGTTNRTHPRDYEAAIGPDTALLMKAHTSNYLVQGFTASVPAAELARLAKARGVTLVDDLGSGTLVDLARYGLRPEPTVQQALAAGADIVTFSGDKLLGGPQCGFIAGRRDLVRAIARNPMKRALRLDKVRLAALEATLKLYRDPDSLARQLPTLRYFTRPRTDIVAQACRVQGPLAGALGDAFAVTVTDCDSQIGSGALPLDTLPSAGLTVRPAVRKSGGSLDTLAAALRGLPVPVVGRIHDGALLLDLRCLDDEAGFLAQLPALAAALGARATVATAAAGAKTRAVAPGKAKLGKAKERGHA